MRLLLRFNKAIRKSSRESRRDRKKRLCRRRRMRLLLRSNKAIRKSSRERNYS